MSTLQLRPVWFRFLRAASPTSQVQKAVTLRVRAKAQLSQRSNLRVGLICASLAILLTLPALWVGFATDDIYFLMLFEGKGALPELSTGTLDTFQFSSGDLAVNAARMQRGMIPWYALPDWQVSFWRPLSSLSHWVDYQIFGRSALPMHIHSLLLYGLLAFSVALLYRRLMPGMLWASGLAAVMFAMDAAHGIPAGWIADRNALLSALFGVWALYAHDRARQGDARTGAWRVGALGCVALALFSGEAAASVGAYLFAYALFLDPMAPAKLGFNRAALRGLLASFVALLPYLGVVAVWRGLYVAMGHGVNGSWLYIDPIHDFEAFAQNVVEHAPVLLLSVFAEPDSVLWSFIPREFALAWLGLAIAALVFMGWAVAPLLKRSAVARFWLLGTLLSIVPCCATIPGARILMYPSLGAMALLGLFLVGVWERAPWQKASVVWQRSAKGLATAMAGFHIVLSPFLLLFASYSIVPMDKFFHATNDSVPQDAIDAGQRIVVINTPMDMLAATTPLFRIAEGSKLPEAWWCLTAGLDEVDVKRVDSKTIALRQEGGFLQKPWSQVFRRADAFPLVLGHTVQLDGMKAQVTELRADGRPAEVRFTFDVALEDESLRFLTWDSGNYVDFHVPPVGHEVASAATPGLELLQLALGATDAVAPEKLKSNDAVLAAAPK